MDFLWVKPRSDILELSAWGKPASFFFANQIRERVRNPVKAWYPKRGQETVSELTSIFEDLPNVCDDTEIVRNIEWQIFNPKRSLMAGFRRNVWDFARLVDPTNNRYVLEERRRGEERRRKEASLELARVRKMTLRDKVATQRAAARANATKERLQTIQNLETLPLGDRLMAVVQDQRYLPSYYPEVARHGIEPCPPAFQASTLPSSSRATIWWTVRDSNSHFTGAGRG